MFKLQIQFFWYDMRWELNKTLVFILSSFTEEL